MKAKSGKGQNRIKENDRKTYAFPGLRGTAWSKLLTQRMLLSNDIM